MTRSEAIDMLRQIREYLTAGNPIWDIEPIEKACDMAIEALTEKVRGLPSASPLPTETVDLEELSQGEQR